MTSSSHTLRETLGPILTVLKQFGGYFTFTDSDGQQFIIAARHEFERIGKEEKQLPLPDRKTSRADKTILGEEDTANVLERFNREIAFSQEEAEQDEEEEPVLTETQSLRVRFEPLKGDLPPELQE